MEVSFEKRYILIYTLIIALAHHIILNINAIYENFIKDIWPVDALILVFTLLFLSMFSREQKERISLGIFYKKTPFENAKKYIKKDQRIDQNSKEIQGLYNIQNFKFYNNYYKPVIKIKSVETKNSEYCIIRDIVFTIFIFVIIFIILTIKWKSYFWKELVISITAYIVGVVTCRKKAKDFVSQIVIEKINKKEESK